MPLPKYRVCLTEEERSYLENLIRTGTNRAAATLIHARILLKANVERGGPGWDDERLDGGTALTAKLAQQIGKPHWVVALEDGIALAAFQAWLNRNQVAVLNIASPRESKRPGVYDAACRCLESLFG